jgi:16S rRNA (guanine527-N7)-methyltransferase
VPAAGWRARLTEIAAERGLDAPQAVRLAALVELLASDPHAPTAVRDPAEAVDVHIADSLAGLEVPRLAAAPRIADLGSGAGFPGLPLAIALPDARVTLVESATRKADFLRAAVQAAGAVNAEVAHARAEEWEAGRGRCDIVVARALDSLAVLAEYAAPLLTLGGALVAWKGRRDPDEESQGAAAAAQLGLRTAEIVPVQPYSASRDRHLVVMVKDSPTPSRFPRTPGRARKRPLR